MKKFSKLGQALSILALCGAMWLVYTILVFSFEASENLNSEYIPENASTVYRLDGRVLSRELLASLLISEDKELESLAQSKIPTTREGKLKPVGISFDSDIILFQLEENGNEFSGFLFNLWDQRIFDKNMPKYLGKKRAFASIENVGIVLFQSKGNLSKEALKKRAEKVLAKPSNFRKKHPVPADNSLVSIWYKEKEAGVSNVAISVQDNQLLFQGTFESNQNISGNNLANYSGGFHVHSQWVPSALNEQMQALLAAAGIELPPLKQFSLNYFGSTIVTEPNIAGLPFMAGSFEFEEVVEADSIFKQFPVISTNTSTGETIYDVLSIQYAVRQKNPKTIEVQSLEGTQLTKATYASTIEVSGVPKYLTKIEGDRFIKGILVLTSEFKSLSAFVNEVEKVELKMTPKAGKDYRIQGKIVLKDDKWPLNEVLKFLLRNKFF
ncbi:MAG: hypothetical protein ACFHU9_04865 [Fluviicola sp.]